MHFEIPAKDTGRAKAFYSHVFGWRPNDVPMGEGNTYTLVATTEVDREGRPAKPGSINGGIMKQQPPFTGPIITLQVDDISSSLEEVEQNGGRTLVKRTSMGEYGFFGYFADSEGNIMGLFEVPRGAPAP